MKQYGIETLHVVRYYSDTIAKTLPEYFAQSHETCQCSKKLRW